MLKRTKIVATISDKRCDVDFIRSLYQAGMNVARLNTAHMNPESAKKLIDNIRKVSDDIAILVDTKGPEIRTSSNGVEINVETGMQIKVIGNPDGASQGDTIYVSYVNISSEVSIGNTILIDDGEIELKVIDKHDQTLICKATNSGTIKLRKSVNIPNVHINLPSLTEKDKAFVQFAIENNIDFIAHSFVRNKHDILEIKEILNEHNSPIKIIAKIENQQGVDNIDEILDHAYGIMVARGDLGIEIPAEKLPIIQLHIVRKCIESKKPVIIATQMLHTMIEHPRPTRAEISDIANAIYQRTDAIMLSGETAYGQYPIEAVEVMTRVAREVEETQESDMTLNLVRIKNEVTATLAKAAVRACSSLPIKAIIVDTLTGRTGRYLSAFRGRIPVYAICYKQHVMRELALSYGVEAIYMEPRTSRDHFLTDAINAMLERRKIDSEDMVLIIGGSFGPSNGASFMEISKVKNLITKK
ncbi:MAG TPA: pyruvate kinase [Bacteroidales bacterium]|nr:pyruvate kinase [Bacteroidales bacterium]